MASSTEAPPPAADDATASLVPPPAAADEAAASLVPPPPAADEVAASLVPPPPPAADEAAASLVPPPPLAADEAAASLVPPPLAAADEAAASLVPPPPPTAADEAAASLVLNGDEQTLAPGSVETNGAVANGGGAGGVGSSRETLERAEELFEKGSKALKDEDFVEAVDCLSQALEIRVLHHGELAPECAMSYYKYGCALLYKAQEESDPLGDVPKSNPKSTGKDKASSSLDENTSSKTSSVSDSNQDTLSMIEEEEEEDGSDEDPDGAKDGSDADNEEGEEEESDLDMAWKMLELARAIVEKQPEESMEKVNILSALAEVSIEREDFKTSLSDYLKALSILGRLVEPDSRRIVELNFRICIVLELGSKIGEAIPYCKKAISLCNARLQRLREDASNSNALAENKTVHVHDTVNGTSQSSDKADPNPSALEKEIELLKNVSVDLERKLEDMQHSLANPRPDMSEVMSVLLEKKATVVTTSSTEVARSDSQTSSQLGVNNSFFDSPTVFNAATSGSVTHLGVVGRGVKRATVVPTGAEPSPKRSSLDTTAAKDDSGVSEVVNSTGQDAGASAE